MHPCPPSAYAHGDFLGLGQRHIPDNVFVYRISIFRDMCQFLRRCDQYLLREVANRQTDKRQVKHNLLGRSNYCKVEILN